MKHHTKTAAGCGKRKFWGKYARFARRFLCFFSLRYTTELEPDGEPVVYVCRHLNMHGPFTTMKWLPFDVHPMIMHMFFDRKKAVTHLTEYTFGARYGKKAKKFNLAAHVIGRIAAPLMHSMEGVPVYRGGTQTISTMKTSLSYLLQGDSLIVFPDVDYTGSYAQPSEIYDGFLYLGELYHKKTGGTLRFVPLVIDDETRQISAGEPIIIENYRQEGKAVAAKIKQAINKTA